VADGPVTLPNGKVLPVAPHDLAQQRSVQAEMEAEHAGEVYDFTPGVTPAPLSPAASASVTLASTTGDASTTQLDLAGPDAAPSAGPAPGLTGIAASLPNGLRKEVLGFLPYWMLSNDELQWMRYDLVSTIAFFGVAAQSDGTLATYATGWTGWNSSAMTNVINAAHARGVRVVLTVTMMAWDGGAQQAALLGSEAARAQLVNAIVAAVRDRNADGVNLDFEPVAVPQRDQYTSFVRQLKAALVAAGVGSYLTVCTMAGAGTWATGYDLAGLVSAGAADQLFVMGYDYSWSGSARAGGVAPMDSSYMLDVNESVTDYLEIVAASKVIWGVPYYGRTWLTQSDALNALTVPGASGSSKAYYYVGNVVLSNRYGRLWDPVGRVPWFRDYDTTAGSWVEGYYDDAASLAAKWDMVNQRGMAGTGMWTLLMDAGYSDLWNLLASRFVTNAPQVVETYDPPRTLYFAAGNYVGRQFDANGAITASLSYTLGSPSNAPTSQRSTISNQPGFWYYITAGMWAGYWIQESAGTTLGPPPAPPPQVSETYDPPRTLYFAAGTYVGRQFNASGAIIGSLAYTLASPSNAPTNQRSTIPNQSGNWYYITAGVWAGYWIQESAGTTLGPPPPPPSTTFVPLAPARVLDTRVGTGLAGPFSAGMPRTFQVRGAGGVPATATAVTGTLTVTNSTTAGAVYLGPSPLASPPSSTLNFPVGDTRATGVTVALSATGTLSATFIAAAGSTALVFDVTGYFVPDATGATFKPVAPARVLDTRAGTGLAGPFSPYAPRTFVVRGQGGVPLTATAVTGTLTVTNQTTPGWAFLGPDPVAQPASSTLNFPVGDTRATGVTVALSPTGTLSLTFGASGGSAAMLFDVTGYFVPDATGARFVALTPARLLDTRSGVGLSGAFSPSTPRTFVAGGRGGVPTNATALTGTLTATNSTAGGWAYLGPNPVAAPASSTLNFPPGDTRASGVTVALGSGDTLSATFGYSGTTDLLFDVTGYFVP
jgi:spore germination protein YaaH